LTNYEKRIKFYVVLNFAIDGHAAQKLFF
jgi:hypothetical protein